MDPLIITLSSISGVALLLLGGNAFYNFLLHKEWERQAKYIEKATEEAFRLTAGKRTKTRRNKRK